MMIAMVITFTATDTIGDVGGNTKEKQCTGSIQGQCTATRAAYVDLPDSCVTQNDNTIPAVPVNTVTQDLDGDGTDETWTGVSDHDSDGDREVVC
jgi:hypothetical protein